MYQFVSYIKFLIKSTNQHGVHSPFVFDLVTNCFYERKQYPDYSKLQAYRSALLKDETIIEITDFGAGSQVFTSNKRAVKDIAKTSGTSLKRAKLLFRFIAYLKPKSVLELGTSVGIATHTMALANPNARIVTVEGCPQISKVAQEQLEAFHIHTIEQITSSFAESIPTLKNAPWDLIFFDGHHDKAATLAYFNQLLPTVHNNSVFIFDDIHWSKPMTEAWEAIKKHPKVTVTIDTFQWGFVFFRTEQAKENFTIRL